MKLDSLSDDLILKLIITLDIKEIIKFELLNKDFNKFIKKNDNFISKKIIDKKFKLLENSRSYNLKKPNYTLSICKTDNINTLYKALKFIKKDL
jgi:hypothetical protein